MGRALFLASIHTSLFLLDKMQLVTQLLMVFIETNM